MSRGHARNHVATVGGLTAACYFAWSMVLNPGQGPLPGTLLPLAVGVLGVAVGAAAFAVGVRREYVAWSTDADDG